MSASIAISGPFTHADNSVQRTMLLVMLALLPATLFDIWLFGWPALFLFVLTIAFCLLVEALCLKLGHRPVMPALCDGSAILSGWLIALSLPPWAPWWIALLGAVFAMALAKQIFGGLGQNLFNPAMVARVALLISFPVQMTQFAAPHPLFTAHAPDFLTGLRITLGCEGNLDSLSAASALGHIKTELTRGIPVTSTVKSLPSLKDMILGIKPGSMGETSALFILLGGLFLLWRRIITWHIPVAMLVTLFGLGWIFSSINPNRFASGVIELLSGASMLGAFFIATDYVTSPVSKKGQLVFGFGVGFLTWVIRSFAGYPEGVAFAVLLMNATTPIIDHYCRPRVFGRTRQGQPVAFGDAK
ncbi:RnfABCDGE type electron transport complex subunit D [Zymomonas mobilis]|uniref:Ion-translocating oxidoreductase complex subunit D n=1 Tax=Zymomonas mobilis subsp. pomaceae (strain ATCC 29192 / DSM 22645 / JCM 10191 / CCUG 17912 / NBRC 13757 / NCIMB 11200 / NRRL B-4491 / Barker I) TaxID=579138 RepID=F8EUN0_ZYMMT|nr:RnfABCDGE type electron transport complex subunit D [Zymomonas mobilis]AEI38176.1 electron transport complex, RnfABCDGE type, D subunit [Zymomonas mobilis subsp. pomaceae ATCC 29192]AEI38213.1 electron transport complex, RnfABCDGE type, D subunit [Zymomonas mobilis subsp. pomaceae ATCC 29192]MDX5947866.1 RnfABCDGE type electron transport complex subunit D [Zymomonas mobilis subsp. pomaceae]MDX5947903.1 RnfABCDGE type electron transport complex subunit D [Zymomonas mobilis subsp. pomaceae]GE